MADWTHEVETPLLIKYVKIEQRGKQSEQKKIAQKDENVFYCSCYQRKQCSQSNSHYGKIKGIDRYLQHICATCYRKEGRDIAHWRRIQEFCDSSFRYFLVGRSCGFREIYER